MIIPHPFPDELAFTHLNRFLLANNYDKLSFYNEKLAMARTLRHLRPRDAEHAWSHLYTHSILAYLCGMSSRDYRTQHTLMMLTDNWRRVLDPAPVKENKVNVYGFAELYEYSLSQRQTLRLCPQCLADDLKKYSMSYWHREHHLPGIDICITHGTALHQACFSHSSYSPNPASVRGTELPAELVDAQSHPIIQRYRVLILKSLKSASAVQYVEAAHKAKERALDLGMLYYRTSHVGNRSLEGSVSDICSKLPPVWVKYHLLHDLEQRQKTNEMQSYRAELDGIKYPDTIKPAYLLLILASLFESIDEVCSFLFSTPTNHPEAKLCDTLMLP